MVYSLNWDGWNRPIMLDRAALMVWAQGFCISFCRYLIGSETWSNNAAEEQGGAGAAQLMNKYRPCSKSRIHMNTCGHRPHGEGKKYKCMAVRNCGVIYLEMEENQPKIHDRTVWGGYQLSSITLVWLIIIHVTCYGFLRVKRTITSHKP